MNSKTFISLFSGGGGADIGAMMAGYTPIAANEYDPAIAEVYACNIGGHVRVGDILTQDPHDYPACDLLHLSPPCPNFSVAKAGAKETAHDIALAEKAAEFIRVLAPHAVTIENVSAYQYSQSYQVILKAITDGGYIYDAGMMNAADYGVPQTRRRFIVRAVRGLLRPMPEPGRWIGWYEAIEDLIDTLPASEFAPWQLARLPAEFSGSFYVVAQQSDDKQGTEFGYGCPRRSPNEPALTVTSAQSAGWYKAFLMDASGNTNFDDAAPGVGVRQSDEPSHVVSSGGGGRIPRAFIVDGNVNEGERINIRNETEPITGIQASAFKRPFRAYLSQGRVVKMTSRALASFQSFPDWYQLPDKTALACKIIGNACPPLMMAAVFESLA